MSEAVIEANELTKKFGDVTAVDRASFRVEKGEIFGLVGPDGAGKSTLIRLLTTILSPSSGQTTVCGYDLARQPDKIRPRIGYMSEGFSLYGELTVVENLRFFADVHQVEAKIRQERIERLLSFSGLTEFQRRWAEHLSGGMQQKLALACTLIHEPEILFLDEPTTGVDPVSRIEFWRILTDIHTRGVTILVSTPYMDEAERCTRLVLMDKGKIILTSTPTEMEAKLEGELVELTVDSPRQAEKLLQRYPEAKMIEPYGELLQVTVDDAEWAMKQLPKKLKRDGVTVRGVRQIMPSMKNAFVWLMSKNNTGAKK